MISETISQAARRPTCLYMSFFNMLDIDDFQAKKNILAFHNHLSLKVRKHYVEHIFF